MLRDVIHACESLHDPGDLARTVLNLLAVAGRLELPSGQVVVVGEPGPSAHAFPEAGLLVWAEKPDLELLGTVASLLRLHLRQDSRLRQERVDAMARLARRLGHDLRGPLINLRMGVQLLADAEGEEERDVLTVSLLGELERSQKLMEGLVDLARSSQPNLSNCRLPSVIHQAARDLPRPPGVEIELCVPEVPHARLDPDLQLKLFRHLLSNAVKALGETGSIRVTLEPGKEVRVEDSGPGIESDRVEAIFEPLTAFFADGAGLGLTICRRIAEAHGGSLWVRPSEALGGACFVVAYPEGAHHDRP